MHHAAPGGRKNVLLRPNHSVWHGCRCLWPWLVCSLSVCVGPSVFAATPKLVDVGAADSRVRLDIKYATVDNFTKRRLYPVARCLLRPAVARQLRVAQDLLDAQRPGMRLLLKDCYRPLTIQRALYQSVAQGANRKYVANPRRAGGAVHTYGAAVDLTLLDAHGHEVDMGSAYDYFGPLAEPRQAAACLAAGKLGAQHIANRRLLSRIMQAAGFVPISREWWHFDALRGRALHQRYRPLDVPLTCHAGTTYP